MYEFESQEVKDAYIHDKLYMLDKLHHQPCDYPLVFTWTKETKEGGSVTRRETLGMAEQRRFRSWGVCALIHELEEVGVTQAPQLIIENRMQTLYDGGDHD